MHCDVMNTIFRQVAVFIEQSEGSFLPIPRLWVSCTDARWHRVCWGSLGCIDDDMPHRSAHGMQTVPTVGVRGHQQRSPLRAPFLQSYQSLSYQQRRQRPGMVARSYSLWAEPKGAIKSSKPQLSVLSS